MKSGSFIIDGVTSESLKTIIQTRPVIEAPLRKVTRKSPYGVDGDLPFDEGAYENTNMELLLFIDGDDLIGDRQKLYNAIDSQGYYKDFIPYFDPGKIYRVMLSDKITFENKRFFGEKQIASVKLTVKPYKYLVENDPITITGLTGQVTNPTNYVAQPIITITGTGPVTLTVNGIPFSIKNVIDTITLNSERYLAYQEDSSGVLTDMNHQIGTREYPIFKPGVNDISVTGNVTKLYIEPRWRSLV